MRRLCILLVVAFTLVGITAPVESKPKKLNDLYTAYYDYEFKEEKDVTNCIARASAALAKNGLSERLKSEVKNGGQYGYVYGWNADGTAIAEIKCIMKRKLSILGYARYADEDDNGSSFKNYKLLSDTNW